MADERNTDASVEYFPPSISHAETRDHTYARVVEENHLDDWPEPLDGDSTTMSGGNLRIVRRVAVCAAVAAVIGAIVGLILALSSGPFGDDSTMGIVGHVVILGLAFGLITTLVATMMMLGLEDGRQERELEEYTGHKPL